MQIGPLLIELWLVSLNRTIERFPYLVANAIYNHGLTRADPPFASEGNIGCPRLPPQGSPLQVLRVGRIAHAWNLYRCNDARMLRGKALGIMRLVL
jgi:hypothetical protein